MSDLTSWLLLSAVPGIGAHRFHTLLCRFGSPAAILKAPLAELLTVPRLGPQTATVLSEFRNHDFVKGQLYRAKKYGVQIVTLYDDMYPEALKQIYDPPPLLYMKGTLTPQDEHALAIVGTRRTSTYGRQMTEKFSAALCGYGITVVSGLARGIDTISHRTALKQGGRTVAVLGSGLDRPYPPENKKLMEVIAQNGAVISEQPMGAGPDAVNFPQRNRIISGISAGILAIEAGRQSGALITAQYALEHDREVFAIPGPLNSATSEGTNLLIKQGTAKLIQHIEDIIEELAPKLKLPSSSSRKTPDNPPVSLPPEEETIYAILTDMPIHIDRIAIAGSLSTSSLLTILLSLELKGLIRQLPGKMFIRS